MIPTYTYAIKEKIIKDYLGGNLVIALINNSNMGQTDLPSSTQLDIRRSYTSLNLGINEIGASNLNGYKRYIILNSTINPLITSVSKTEVDLTASFTASGGNFDPITHVVVLRGANITGASNTNGNNRGDTTGTIIFIEPVLNSLNPGTPLIIQSGITFNYNFKLASSDEII